MLSSGYYDAYYGRALKVLVPHRAVGKRERCRRLAEPEALAQPELVAQERALALAFLDGVPGRIDPARAAHEDLLARRYARPVQVLARPEAVPRPIVERQEPGGRPRLAVQPLVREVARTRHLVHRLAVDDPAPLAAQTEHLPRREVILVDDFKPVIARRARDLGDHAVAAVSLGVVARLVAGGVGIDVAVQRSGDVTGLSRRALPGPNSSESPPDLAVRLAVVVLVLGDREEPLGVGVDRPREVELLEVALARHAAGGVACAGSGRHDDGHDDPDDGDGDEEFDEREARGRWPRSHHPRRAPTRTAVDTVHAPAFGGSRHRLNRCTRTSATFDRSASTPLLQPAQSRSRRRISRGIACTAPHQTPEAAVRESRR